jgi:hypothetical protein
MPERFAPKGAEYIQNYEFSGDGNPGLSTTIFRNLDSEPCEREPRCRDSRTDNLRNLRTHKPIFRDLDSDLRS